MSKWKPERKKDCKSTFDEIELQVVLKLLDEDKNVQCRQETCQITRLITTITKIYNLSYILSSVNELEGHFRLKVNWGQILKQPSNSTNKVSNCSSLHIDYQYG